MAITEWPELERPRDKLLRYGGAMLSDAELLAISLRTGCRGKTALDLARDLLNKFNGLRGLLEASQAEICQLSGMGSAKYAQLMASLALMERFLLHEFDRGEALQNPTQTSRFLKMKMRSYQHEVFACLYLDNQHRVIRFEELFKGTIDGASVYPREVVKQALANNAAAIILAHNHPSGIAEPSQADIRITDKLKSALLLVDIRVLDHLIIGDQEVLSFAESGIL
jgi:DNA repair protein RadC